MDFARVYSAQMNLSISMNSPDKMVIDDDWSDLSKIRQVPDIDRERLHDYRVNRLKGEMARLDVGLCVMVSPISLRYALDYRNYALFCSHIPCTYLFMGPDGEYVLHNAFDPDIPASRRKQGTHIS